MTVVSLFPSATEVAAELGVVPAAVSHQCDHPPAVADRPTLTGLVRELDDDPEDVDRIVAFDDVYYLDGDVLAAADPDVVLTQGVCAVCALDAGLAHEAVDELGLDATVLDVHADDLGDVLANVERIGDAIGRPEAGSTLRDEMEARLGRVRERSAERDDDSDGPGRPRVAVLDWTDPIRHAGLWAPELIEAAGGTCGLAAPGVSAGKVSTDELRAFDPEIIVVAPCGYDLGEAAGAATELLEHNDLEDVTAVRTGRVYAMDGAAYFNRHSHRVVDTAEALAAVVRPTVTVETFDDSGDSANRIGEAVADRVRRLPAI